MSLIPQHYRSYAFRKPTFFPEEPNDLHPKNKKDVGLRLARLAEARLHNLKVEDSGPTLDLAKKSGSGWTITFHHAEGLGTSEGPLKGFEVAGADGKFLPAQATVENNLVVVSAAEIPDPAAVRYGWGPVSANLTNSSGLPAVPFRTALPK